MVKNLVTTVCSECELLSTWVLNSGLEGLSELQIVSSEFWVLGKDGCELNAVWIVFVLPDVDKASYHAAISNVWLSATEEGAIFRKHSLQHLHDRDVLVLECFVHASDCLFFCDSILLKLE